MLNLKRPAWLDSIGTSSGNNETGSNSPAIAKRAVFVVIFLSLLFSGLLVRLYHIQVTGHKKYLEQQKAQCYLKVAIQPKAGMIFSRNGKLLAISNLVYSVYADPQIVKDNPQTINTFCRTLGLPVQEIQTKINSLAEKEKHFIWIKRRISESEFKILKELNLAGVGFQEEYKRFYPNGSLACHILGYRGIDEQALDGVELSYDELLMGECGYRWVPRDARQKKISSLELISQTPRPGKNVYLTIDTTIQFIAEEELNRACEKWKPLSASTIVLDPRTGEVLGLANRPNFDPNYYNKYSDEARRNRIITDQYEPGSTAKPLTAAALLDNSLVGLNNKFFCENGIFKTGFRTIHDHHPYGQLTFTEIISQSSNIGMAKLGLLLGKEKMYTYIKRFGLGESTGLGLPGETSGLVTPYRQWDKFTITSVPMGHEVAVTTMQLAKAYLPFANGGYLLRPQVISKITGEEEIIKQNNTEIIRQIFSQRTAQQMKSILIDVVNNGTGSQAKIPNYQIAGKTGTTTKLNPDGTYSHQRFISLFVGFAPADNPRILVLAVVDEPKGAYYGGTVATPIVTEIITKTLKYWGIPGRIPVAQR
ncbi:MAG: penicillin-binding protein 2 [Planctomycetota bacterium]